MRGPLSQGRHGKGACGRCSGSVLGPLPIPPLLGAVLCTAALSAGLVVGPGSARAAQALGASGVSEARAIRVANRDPKAVEERERNPDLAPSASMVDGNWEVGYFAHGKEVALVVVDPATGLVRESWTGYQVAWKMARGYSGAFGHRLDAPYVFLPLCALFLVGLFDWRRPRRVANLDLLVLLGFGISHIWFNRGEIGVSVPLQYPPLLYLLARALWIGFRGRGEGLRAGLASGLAADRRPVPDRASGSGSTWPTPV